MMANYGLMGRPAWSYLPFGHGIWKEQQAEKGTQRALEETEKAMGKSEAAKSELNDAQSRYDAYIKELETRQAEQKQRELQAEAARRFEKSTRESIGMDTQTLDVLYNYEKQLAEEQLEVIKENTKTTERGGVPEVKIPWTAIGLFGVAALGTWYWSK